MLRECVCLLLCAHAVFACLSVDTPTGNTNEVARQFKEDGCISSPLDILAVIDGSGSVTAANFELTKDFFVSLTQKMEGDHRFAATQYSSTTKTEFLFQAAAEAGVSFSNIVWQTGSTHVAKALEQAEVVLADASNRGSYPDVLLMTIDGPHNGPGDPSVVAKRIRDTGVTIVIVSIGGNVKDSDTRSIVEDPKLIIKGEFDTLQSYVLEALTLLICPT